MPASRLMLVPAQLAALLLAAGGCGPHSSDSTPPLIGEPAPQFTAPTTMGEVSFPSDLRGQWVILFSHPGDFTPVCTTEFMTFASVQERFEQLNCQLIGLSVDTRPSHIAWVLRIEEKARYRDMEGVVIRFPIIADPGMRVAKLYGMVHPAASRRETVRAVYVIDPKGIIRAVLYYPLTTGRNIAEVERLLIALQTTDAHGVSTPADWQPGEDVILPSAGSCGSAAERIANPDAPGVTCPDWYLCFKRLPKSELTLPDASPGEAVAPEPADGDE